MTGYDRIDFADIDPTKVRAPSYSGDAAGGTLTATDGRHAANIALLGNYMASSFAPRAMAMAARWSAKQRKLRPRPPS